MATIVNALIGAVVAIVLSFVPFSPALGGAAAGFLEGADGRDGTISGALSGLFTMAPLAIGGFFVLAFLGLLSAGGSPAGGFLVVSFFVVLALVAFTIYTVGFAALGGYLGAYLAREYPDARADTRDTLGMAPDPIERRDGVATVDSRTYDSVDEGDRYGWDRRQDEADGGRDEDRYERDRLE